MDKVGDTDMKVARGWGEIVPRDFAAYIKLVREAKKVSLPNNVTSKDILTRIGAIDKKTGRITNGAIPLFAKHPEEIKTIIWRNGYGPMSKRYPGVGPSRGIQSAPGQRAQSGARVRGPERAQKALSLGTKSRH